MDNILKNECFVLLVLLGKKQNMQRAIISLYLTKDLKGCAKNCYHKHLLNFLIFF